MTKKTNNRDWSRRFSQTVFGVWNCWSLSNERYHYPESLKYDILGLTELHNNQGKEPTKGDDGFIAHTQARTRRAKAAILRRG